MADKKTYYYLKLKEGFFDSEDMLLLQGIRRMSLRLCHLKLNCSYQRYRYLK